PRIVSFLAVVLPQGAVIIIGAGFGGHQHHAADAPAIFGLCVISDNAKLLSYFNTGIEIQNVRFASSIRGAGAVDVKHRQLSRSGEAKKRSIGIGRVYAVIGDAGNDPDQLLRTPHHRRKLSDQLLLDSISHSWRTGFQSWCLCLDLNALRYL